MKQTRSQSPEGTIEISPAFQRWGSAQKRNKSRQGRQSRVALSGIFFRPSWAFEIKMKGWSVCFASSAFFRGNSSPSQRGNLAAKRRKRRKKRAKCVERIEPSPP